MPSRPSSPIWRTTASSIQPDLSHSAARGVSSLWANWRAMSRIMRWSSFSSMSCIYLSPSGLARLEVGEERCHPGGADLVQRRRIPLGILVLVDDEGAYAFHDVALCKPLGIQVQLQRKAIGQTQFAALAQQLQGDAHAQWRFAVDSRQRTFGPVLVGRAFLAGQRGADARHVRLAEMMINGRAHGLDLRARNLLRGAFVQQGVQVAGGRIGPLHVVQCLV